MLEISKIWDNLTDKNQAELLEALAGKQRGNSIAALLTNMAQAENVLNVSMNSAGSAAREQQRWMDSLEAKVQQLEAAFQGLSITVLDSDDAKKVVDFATTSVNALTELIDILGPLGTLGVGLGGFMSAKGIGEHNYSSGDIAPAPLRLHNNAM